MEQPTVVDLINEGLIDMVVTTRSGPPRVRRLPDPCSRGPQDRPAVTTLQAFNAMVAIESVARALRRAPLQEWTPSERRRHDEPAVRHYAQPSASATFYAAMREHGPVCVVSIHTPSLLPSGALTTTRTVCESFLRVVEALGGRAAAFKPQAAFFDGTTTRRTWSSKRSSLPAVRWAPQVSWDAKLRDIGSTMVGCLCRNVCL